MFCFTFWLGVYWYVPAFLRCVIFTIGVFGYCLWKAVRRVHIFVTMIRKIIRASQDEKQRVTEKQQLAVHVLKVQSLDLNFVISPKMRKQMSQH